MVTADILTLSSTRFEPPSFSSEELGDAVHSSRRQSRLLHGVSTTSPTLVSGPALCAYVIVEQETTVRDLEALRQAWSHAQENPFMEARTKVTSRARGSTTGMVTAIERRRPTSFVHGSVTVLSGESDKNVEQEYEFFVTPQPQRVRHATARIVSRSRPEPNPVLD